MNRASVCATLPLLVIGVATLGGWLYIRNLPGRPYVVAGWLEYERIEVGMRQEVVESVLGGPPGDYIPTTCEPCIMSDSTLLPNGELRTWTTCEGEIMVGFDSNGKVVDKQFYSVLVFQRPTLVERLRSSIGL